MREGKHYLAVGTEEQKEEKGKIQGPEYQKRILIETHNIPPLHHHHTHLQNKFVNKRIEETGQNIWTLIYW